MNYVDPNNKLKKDIQCYLDDIENDHTYEKLKKYIKKHLDTIIDDYTYEKLGNDVGECLKTIIGKLKKGQISVMVGAGFSKNAHPDYPDWAELLVRAYCEIYSIDETNIGKIKKQNIKNEIKKDPSSIAKKYMNFHGNREALDIYIEDELSKPEKNSSGHLRLHEELLSLNWNDVITTNWDSLLERADDSGNYEIVTSAKNLKLRNQKRIIKIHGSLRDSYKSEYSFDDNFEYLYVITQDDFDNYHKEHSDFSNFMKVKFLQDSFCLIGFSGDDPNFRYWIKELKRTMTKGGNTAKPNPIFLIDISNDNPTAAKLQYYKNNYIIRLSLNDAVNHIRNSTGGSISNSIGDANFAPNIKLGNDIKDRFHEFFDYLKEQANQSLKRIEKDPKENIKSRNVFDMFIFLDKITDTERIKGYNDLSLYHFDNLFFSMYLIASAKCLFTDDIKQWSGTEYDFIYKVCTNNYYSLLNLYNPEQIDKIIEDYQTRILPKKQEIYFSQLILKYYRETGNDEKFDTFYKGLCEQAAVTKNIAMYEQAIKLYSDFDNRKLQEHLQEWKPEDDEKPDSIFILKKLTLLTAFHTTAFNDSEKKYVDKLLTIAENHCTNKQTMLFILLYRRLLSFQFGYLEPNNIIHSQIAQLKSDGFKEPFEYINELLNVKEPKNIKPNSDKRYALSETVISSWSNEDTELIKTIRIINFIEYTGIPADFCISKSTIINLVSWNKEDEWCLLRIFLFSLLYYGKSLNEEFLRFIVPRILRYVSMDVLLQIYNKIFDILKYTIKHGKGVKTYIYIMTEIIKRLPSKECTGYVEYIITEIKNNNAIIVSLIINDGIYGTKRPFLEVLKHISKHDDYEYILKWIMTESLKDEHELVKSNSQSTSVFINYYIPLMIDNKFCAEKNELFKSPEIKEMLKKDMNLRKKLSLYAYDYIDENTKNELNRYLENNYTLQIHPYFITKIKTEKIKEKCLEFLKNYNISSSNSYEYPLNDYITALVQSKQLMKEDMQEIYDLAMDKYRELKRYEDRLKSNRFMPNRYDYLVGMFFAIVRLMINEGGIITGDDYIELENEYKKQRADFFEFKWIFAEDTQQFKKYFLHMFFVFSYHYKLIENFVQKINDCLSRIQSQDSSEFEAPLEQFISMYDTNYNNSNFKDGMTDRILIRILKKFKSNIDFCYDDLFIKGHL
ncbi:SIR2 family protein [Treponema phagedenis]|uniref:SIR2 family protein n=1 Tax=Treponema phagedenis TaxID=162 RepID=UPI0011E75323|nr:SIR2 family protein [Treponema phagedenis]QEK00263.1 hypothetical protein FUT84_03120 [Treponema phagedenis]QEK07754.1 hypothetical protein FUT80_14215 [Treponema phagedenis]